MTKPIEIDFEDLEAKTSPEFVGFVKENIKGLIFTGFTYEDSKHYYRLFVATFAYSFVFRFGKKYRSFMMTEIEVGHLKIINQLYEEIQVTGETKWTDSDVDHD